MPLQDQALFFSVTKQTFYFIGGGGKKTSEANFNGFYIQEKEAQDILLFIQNKYEKIKIRKLYFLNEKPINEFLFSRKKKKSLSN